MLETETLQNINHELKARAKSATTLRFVDDRRYQITR